MPFPSLTGLTAFTAEQRRQIQQFGAYLYGWLSREHDDDGRHQMGRWTSVPYNAANFQCDSGTWGVDAADVATLAYMFVDDTMTVAFEIFTTDVSGPPSELWIQIPAGKIAAKQMRNFVEIVDAGATGVMGHVYVTAAGRVLRIGLLSGSFTATSADNTSVFGQITFEVQQ